MISFPENSVDFIFADTRHDQQLGDAFHEATEEWGSAEYRMDVAATLAKRCLERLAQ